MNPSSYVTRATIYARSVVSGSIPACKWVRLACQRQLDDLERWKAKDAPYQWRTERANYVCAFIEQLPHIKGEWARRKEKIHLEDWQCFILTAVFGWYRADGSRRYRMVFIEVPRKAGKSSLSAAVGLYMLTSDGESGAEVYSAATTRDQARIIFQTAQDMANREPDFRAAFGVQVGAHNINVLSTNSKFEALSADASTLDGLNISCALIDEVHAHPTRKVVDVIETATGSRRQPLQWEITTAGSDKSGICYEHRSYVCKILEKVTEDETFFGVIYTIDEGDDWQSPKTWCLAGDTKIYALLEKGPTTCTLHSLVNDLNTDKIRLWDGQSWVRILGCSKADPADKKVRLRLRSGQRISCTAHHLWPTQRGKVRADEIKVGDVIATTILPDSTGGQPEHIPDEVGWLVGLYLAEGSKTNERQKCGSRRKLQFAGHINELESRVKRISRLAESYGGTCHGHGYGNRSSVLVESPILYEIVDQYVSGNTSHGKYLSPRTWRRTNGFLAGVVDGYLEGDGCFDAENSRYRLGFCRNDRLADSIRTLAARLGAQCRLNTAFVTSFGKRHPIYRGEWRNPLSRSSQGRNDNEVMAIESSSARDFWHIGVENETGLFALASGVLSYNSKANPNLGISMGADDLARKAAKAAQLPAALSNFLTKHLNVWVSADSGLFDMLAWDKARNPELKIEDMTGAQCFIALDLGFVDDIASMVLVFKPKAGKPSVFTKNYLPEETIEESRNSQYSGWHRSGRITATDGNVTDINAILDDLEILMGQYDVRDLAFDPYNKLQLINQMQARGIDQSRMVEFPQTVPMISPATEQLMKAIKSGDIEHDGDPVLAWALSNVVGHFDNKNNVYPKKERAENKIDPAIALIMAYSRAMGSNSKPKTCGVLMV